MPRGEAQNAPPASSMDSAWGLAGATLRGWKYLPRSITGCGPYSN